MIAILRKRIADEYFIGLLWKFLKAGYMEDWNYHNTYSGTPHINIDMISTSEIKISVLIDAQDADRAVAAVSYTHLFRRIFDFFGIASAAVAADF